MRNCLLYAFSLFATIMFAQEELGPLTGNTSIEAHSLQLKSDLTFDSTIIYYPDTLTLPFFDEFSKNHFQQYNADYSDPGITSDKKYRLLDNTTLLPLSNEVSYTAQATFRRTYDLATSTFVDETFTPLNVKVGNLQTYPVNYVTTPVYPPYYIYDTVGAPDVSDTIWIAGPEFYQDSATQFFATLNDPDAYWLDHFAYHNYRYAFEPRSLGVVTFDGLDEAGFPYAIGSTITNYADLLTSKPIDMSGIDAADSVYFSFLYQRQGFGDIPEDGDSLVLEFYLKDLDQWKRVWSTNGGAVGPFEVGHINIVDVDYFKKGFQFRFRNYGSLAGALDHFHLDYVHLRTLSGFQDTLFKDFAFVYPVGSLLKDYTSVPWDHYRNNPSGKMTDAAELVVHNGSNLAENQQDAQVEISYGGVSEGVFAIPGAAMSNGDLNFNPLTTYTSYHDLSGGYQYDETKPGTVQSFEILATAAAQFPNLPQNDSTAGIQYFANYYSYDDGSAEAAYGPTGAQARLAVRYDAYEEDSLIGVRIHFVPSVNDVSDKLFLLTVWDDNGGEPGVVLYEDDAFFPRQPVYSQGHNKFFTYYFEDTAKIKVGQTFYVGWRQFDPDRLNVGLDRNLVNNDKSFYSIDNGFTWTASSIEGSVMIHPVFSTSLDAELGVEQPATLSYNVEIYPNPTSDKITIRTDVADYSGAEVYSAYGQLVAFTDTNIVDLVHLTNGVYFVRLKGYSQKTFKVIVTR